jgi:hypothetical protein
MPYKDPEAKRRYMSRYYEQKIKTGEIPSTAYRKGSYGLTDKKPERPKRTGGAEYKERIPKGFTSLGNGVVMRFIKPGET